MSNWFITPKQKFYAVMLTLLTVVFGVLTALSFGDGTTIFKEQYPEAAFELQEAKPEYVKSFTLDSGKLCKLEVKGMTLDQSWVWAKVTVLDEKDRPVLDYKFNLSYYHGYEGGESWSEGDRDEYKMMRLPKGKYRVMLYAEDAPDTTRPPSRYSRKGYSTINRNEIIQIKINSGVWMTRYFLTLFIIFGALMALYFYIRSERAQYEQPVTYGGYGDGDDPYGYQDPNQGYYQQNQQGYPQDYNNPNDPNRQG